MKTMRERFEEKFRVTPACWLWTAAIDENGRGRFLLRARQMRIASRIAYALYVGPIPSGMLVCHKCDVRHCVNPDHLFLGTHKDNMQDKARNGRGRNGLGIHATNRGLLSIKLSPAEVQKIRADHRPSTKIAKEFSVHPSHVRDIKARKKWTHI